MPLHAIRSWLGLADAPAAGSEPTPLRDLVDTLEHLDPDRARHLARFAYVLGRVAHADRHITAEETRAMEEIVAEEGALTADQAMVVVGLAKSSNAMFGGTADFQVAQEFAQQASYEQKLGLVRCLFRVAATDAAISMAEEAEIHRVANQFKIAAADVTSLRVAHSRFLPGLQSSKD